MKEDLCKILVVDDMEANVRTMQMIFSDLPVTVVCALSGNEALSIILKESDFACILMDVQMPEMDGFETASIIHKNPSTVGIPIIFITAFSHHEVDVLRGYASGAVDYMLKPLNHRITISKVQIFCELHRQKRRLLQFRSIVDQTLDAIFVIDLATWAISDVNQHVCERLGYSPIEMQQMSITDIESMSEKEGGWQSTLVKIQQVAEASFCTIHRCSNGDCFPVEVNVKRVSCFGQDKVVAVARDITEQRRNEEQLKSKNRDLEDFNRLAVNRERRMIELKLEVNELSEALGRPQPYDLEGLLNPSPLDDVY